MDNKERMQELIRILNEASKAYYQDASEIMSNYEYDALYDELVKLEEETGVILSNSPTQNVGYEVLSALPKETHASRMLSLDKTKDRQALADWLGQNHGLLSWKLDGLTIVLTYENGELIKAVTRGNGEIGEVITPNAKVFANIPLRIAYKGRLVLRGEAVIKYSDFEKINSEIEDVDAKYKNPRNLCSGSVRQLDPKITKKRNVHFFAFNLVSLEDEAIYENSRLKQFEFLASQGFEVVEHVFLESSADVIPAIEEFERKIESNDFPSDGLVMCYDDIAYGRSLGQTAKFPRDSIAFKWMDEIAVTTLREIEWSASRTGLINPVAIFDPVEIEGTTVSRASVHNVSIVKELKLGIGDQITVYKANMIIPQIAENLSESGNLEIPKVCPVCGGDTIIKNENGVETLYCANPLCPAKQIKGFALLVSRDALNIEGLSEATLEKFIARGMISEPADLFHLERYRDEIVTMEGFGEKSYANIIASVDRARETNAERVLYALGVAGIGVANAKLIARHCGGDFIRMKELTMMELLTIDGIGDVIASDYTAFFADEDNMRIVNDLLECVNIEVVENKEVEANSDIEGKTFVITGSLEHFGNRKELQAIIEELGGKCAGSVSKKTDYLINNDFASNSSKNKTAKELGIPIITEEQFLSEILRREI